MKAYAVDLRERVIKFVEQGGNKREAARRFRVGRRTVYRYLDANKRGSLSPKKSWGHWRKLDPQKLAQEVRRRPDATLKELQDIFGVSHNAVWIRLRQLGFKLKKTHQISRSQSGSTLALWSRTGRSGKRTRVLSRRVRNRSSTLP